MKKSDIKDLIENIIQDLTNDLGVSAVLLKSQTVAHFLGNNEFSAWVKNEQNGYEDASSLPEYRKIPCMVYARVANYHGEITRAVPHGAINSKYQYLYDFTVMRPIAEIESIALGCDEKTISQPLNAAYFGVFQVLFPGCFIQSLNREVSTSSFKGVLSCFKSKLLDFFLRINNELDFDLDFYSTKNQQIISNYMVQNITAGIVHTGTGNVDTSNSTIVGGHNNIINDHLRKEIECLLEQIESINERVDEDEIDIAECISEIQQQLKKQTPEIGFIKRSLKFLSRVPKIAAESAIATTIEQLIEKLL